jgi:hypothetical protein
MKKYMKNIAKCNLCNKVIESFHSTDMVMCACGEIYVYGGTGMYCGAKHWENFSRIDEDGNVIIPKIIEKDKVDENEAVNEWAKKETQDIKPMNKNDLINELDRMISSYENLPQSAMSSAISYYDFVSLMLLISALFKSDLETD